MTTDDHKGMDQGIQEQEALFLTHHLLFSQGEDIEQQARIIQLHNDLYPLLTFG